MVNFSSCCNTVPCIQISQFNTSTTSVTLQLNGSLPSSGRFNLRGKSCCESCCSALPIQLQDSTTTITTIYDLCGNPVPFGHVVYQLRKYGVVHFCRSSTTPTIVICRDSFCGAPTVTSTSTASANS